MHLVIVDVQPIRASADFRLVAIAQHIASGLGGCGAILQAIIAVYRSLAGGPQRGFGKDGLTAFPRVLDAGQDISRGLAGRRAEGNGHVSSRNAADPICQSSTRCALAVGRSVFVLMKLCETLTYA